MSEALHDDLEFIPSPPLGVLVGEVSVEAQLDTLTSRPLNLHLVPAITKAHGVDTGMNYDVQLPKTPFDYDKHYGDEIFIISNAQMRGGFVDANEKSRVRAITKALGEVAGDFVPKGYEATVNSAKSFHQFMHSEAIIRGERIPRNHIMPMRDGIQTLERWLEWSNHPTWQIAKKIELEYSDLGIGIVHRLQEIILTANHSSELREIFDSRLAQYRKTVV